MSTKDNPGTLRMNLYLTEKPASQPFDFGKIGEVQGETIETVTLPQEGRGDERRGQVILSSRLLTLSILPQILHFAK